MGRRTGGSDSRKPRSANGRGARSEQSKWGEGEGSVRAKKHLGQHFLTDMNIARKIAESISGGRELERIIGEMQGGSEKAAKSCGEISKDHSEVPGESVEMRQDRSEVLREGTATHIDHSEYQVESGQTKEDSSKTRERENSASAYVLEVGCGTGVLTKFLLERSDIVTYGAEVDSESIAYLREHYPEFSPRLIEGDFLRIDLRERFPDARSLRIIGNFPYNISSQIFFKVIENRDFVCEVVGMVQKEVAVRIAEPPGSRQYGILSVLLQAWYDIEYLFTVNENVFTPPPKVKSAVIRLKRNRRIKLDCDEVLFVKVVKASFGQRRKMLRNSLRAVFGNFDGQEHPFFSRRAEELGVEEFAELTRWVEKNI